MNIFNNFGQKSGGTPTVGDIIEVGEWSGKPLQWIILNIYENEGCALLLSKYALVEKKYHDNWQAVTWEGSSLRQYLQTEFMKDANFNSEEKKRIIPMKNTNPENEEYQTPGGNSTWDKVFLLSIDEYKRYLKCGEIPRKIAMCKNLQRERVWCWLRSPGHNDINAALVRSDGSLAQRGHRVHFAGGCVRPAFYYNLRS